MSKLRMEFYNPFTQETYSKSMPSKVKKSYHLIDTDEKYQIYANDDYYATEFVYMLQDEELGKRLYPIIKKMKENEKFHLACISFYISKIVVNPRSKSLLGFYLKIERELGFEKLSRIGFLNELRLFLEEMESFNYVLEENFPVILEGKCRGFTSFILLLREQEPEERVTQKDFLEYTHVYFQEEEPLRNIEEFFQNVTKKGIEYRCSMHYSISMLQVYYEYYKTKSVPNNFLEKLENEIESRAYKSQYLACDCQDKACYECKPQMILFSRETLEKQYAECVVESEYTQYRHAENELHDCVLYSMDQKEVAARIEFLNRWCNLRDYVGFSLVSCIFDMDNKLIGYMYSQPTFQQKFVPLKEFTIREDNDLHWIQFLWSIDANIRQVRDTIGGKNRKRVEEIFDLEEIILSANSEDIIFNNESSFMRISYAKGTSIQKSLGRLALLLYAQYVRRSNVGIEETERNLYHTVSFKILPPIFVAELYQFMTGQDVDFLEAYKSFFEDFLQNKEYEKDKNGLQYIFYSKYILNPLTQNYIFLDELEEELNQQIVPSADTIEYPLKTNGKIAYISTHGGRFLTGQFLKDLRFNEEIIEELGIDFNDKKCHLHKIGVDKLVYKKEIDEDGTYQLYGYIGDQKRYGSLLGSLLYITNKEFLKVAMNLFIYFNRTNQSISLDAIKIDDNFELYIDMQEKIVVESRDRRRSATFADYLLNDNTWTPKYITEEFKNTTNFSDYEAMKQLYNSLDAYCDIHRMWYPSKEGGCDKCKEMVYFLNSKDFSDPVFEDQYATHYDLKDGNYLKVYKAERVDIVRQKENLEEYLTYFYKNSYHLEQVLGQTLDQVLFLPEKIAMVLPEKEFVGSVYKAVDFSECIPFEDFQNVTRLKSLLALCMQLQELDRLGYKFRVSPFNSIFFHRQYKGVMQLVNIDLLNFTSEKCMTPSIGKMLKKYVTKQLKSSEDLEPLKGISSTDEAVLKDIMKELRDNIEKMNKYCSIHKRYYHQKYVLCPVCFPNFKTSDLKKLSVLINVKELRRKKKRFEGGEAVLYDYSYDFEEFLAKLFKRKGIDKDVETEVDLSAKLCILLKLFERRDVLVGLPIGCKFVYVLPQFIILDPHTEEISGYLLKEVKGKPISSLRDNDVVERMGFSFTDILEILITVGEGIRYLHEKANIFIGDLSGNNIMYDRDKVVYFLDFDGMGIDNIAPQFFTDDYVDPNARKRGTISMEDDWYSFAILAFYYLTRVHPFNGIYYQEEGRPLEISERMELRISLLGDHGVKVPEMARDWKWMEGKLFDTFLGIFEGDLRVDITPYLKQYYNKMTGIRRYSEEECKTEHEMKPEVKGLVSLEKPNEQPKVTEESVPGLTDISHEYLEYSRIVRENVYVTSDKESLHLYTKSGMHAIHYDDGSLDSLRDVLISPNERLAFLVFNSKIDVISIINGELLRSESSFCSLQNIAISHETLYLAERLQAENVLLSYDFSGDKAIGNVIKFQKRMRTKALSVCDNSKFVVIKTDEIVDYIFCNDIQFAKIEETTPDTEYRIFYDEDRKEWLVLNSNGFYMVIKSDGDSVTSSDGKIREGSLESMVYCKGILYIPLEKNIYAFQPKRSQGKDFPCEVVTQESLLIRKKRGFIISNPERKVYEFIII